MSEAKTYKTYYDVARLVIWGEQGENSRRPRMVFGFRDGNPRVIVYTGETGPAAVLTFGAEHLTFGTFLETVNAVISAEPGTKFQIDGLSPIWEDNKPTDQLKLLSSLFVGKSREGVIYFSVLMEGKPKLVFSLKPSVYHKFYDGTKNLLTDADVSVRMATSLVKFLYGVVTNLLVNYTDEEYDHGPRKPAPIKGFGAVAQPKPNSKANEDIINDLDDLSL